MFRVRKSMTLLFSYLLLLLKVSILGDAACIDCKIDFADMKQVPNPRFSNGYYAVGSVENASDDDTSVTYMISRPQTKNANRNQYQENYNGALIVSGGYGAGSPTNNPSTQHIDNRLWSKYQQPQYLEKQQLRDRYHPSTFVNTYEHAGEVHLSPSASETHSVVEGLKPPSSTQDQHSTSFAHQDQHLTNFHHQDQHSTSFAHQDQHSTSFPHQDQYSTSFTHDVHVASPGDIYNYDSYHQDNYGGPYPYSGYQQHLPSITEPPQEERQQSTLFGYYYIGRKLWYIPLYFSIYFVLYVAALIIKSVGRHKIAFPQTLADTVNAGRSYDNQLQAQLMLESATRKFSKNLPSTEVVSK